MNIFVTRKIPEIGIEMLKNAGHNVFISQFERALTRQELKERVAGVDAILSQLVDRIDGEIMDVAGTQLRVVANYAVGFDNINIEAAKDRNIFVTNTPCVAACLVADHAMALLLVASRRIVEADRFSRAGKYNGWEPFLLLGKEIDGKTLGIVGAGQIGTSLAYKAARGFGMNILYCNHRNNESIEKDIGAKMVSLEELLQSSDFISMHVPLNPQTKHMISTEQFNMMKKDAVFVNTARGPVVDELALLHALKNKQIFAAGIDVWEHEPTLTEGLAQLDNIVITPHIASASLETREEMSRVAAENIIAALDGKTPPNCIVVQ